MNYEEAIAFIEGLPRFSPTAMAAGKQRYDLETISYLLSLLDNPQEKLHFVHIAGTNGKGSTAAYIQNILSVSGLRTGLYTSPALERFTERIRIDGKDIDPEELGTLTGMVREKYLQMEEEGRTLPSEFEIVCAVAFLYFLKQRCDVVVLEVGMGGRKDATNVIPTPDLAVITTISFDHTGILGDTLPQIAGEKAGIIKNNGLVLLYPQHREVEKVFTQACKEKQAKLVRAVMPSPQASVSRSLDGQAFTLQGFDRLHTSLLGSYQIYNAAMAVNAACLLRSEKGYRISDEQIREGIASAKWPGRFELMHKSPAVIADGGHNAEGARVLRESLSVYFPSKKIYFVTGVLADKDYRTMIEEVLPIAKKFFTVTPNNPRALSAEELATYISAGNVRAQACESIAQALSRAIKEAGKDGVVCVFGSLSYLGEVRAYLRQM